MTERTLMLAVEVDDPTSELLLRYGKDSAKWNRRAFGLLYQQWRRCGGDWKNSLLKDYLREDASGKLRVDKRSLYTLLLTQNPATRPDKEARGRLGNSVPRPPGLAGSVFLQAQLGHLGTAFENFLDRTIREERGKERQEENKMRRNVSLAFAIQRRSDIPLCNCDRRTRVLRRRCQRRHGILKRFRKQEMNAPQGLPSFREPVVRFLHTQTTFPSREGLPEAIEIPHPYERGRHIRIPFPSSKDEDYHRKLTLLRDRLSGHRIAVEFHLRPGHMGRLVWSHPLPPKRETHYIGDGCQPPHADPQAPLTPEQIAQAGAGFGPSAPAPESQALAYVLPAVATTCPDCRDRWSMHDGQGCILCDCPMSGICPLCTGARPCGHDWTVPPPGGAP